MGVPDPFSMPLGPSPGIRGELPGRNDAAVAGSETLTPAGRNGAVSTLLP